MQDSDYYDSKQSSISGGASFTFGSMTGSGSISFSKDKMDSDYNSDIQQGLQAATGILQGLAGSDIGAAIAGGAAPYLAEQIKLQVGEDNKAANAIAHAILGGVLAELQGKSAVAGAVGAATGELIAQQLYPGKKLEDLTEQEKQNVVALSTLAAGLAGGMVGDSTASAVAGAEAGKNSSSNNHFSLPSGMMDYGQAASSWNQFAVDNNLSPEQTQAGLDKLAKGDLPDGVNITKAIVEGYQDGVLIAGGAYLGPAATAGKVIGGGVLAWSANSGYQYYDLSQPGNENKSWDYKTSAAAFTTGMLAPGRGVIVNTGIAMGGAWFSDGLSGSSQAGATFGGLAGGVFGKFSPVILDKYIGKELPGFAYDIGSSFIFEFTNGATKDSLKPSEGKGSKNAQ